MKKNLQRLASFATFDLPLNVGYSQLLLRTINKEQIAAIPLWNIEDTRRKLIAIIWYRQFDIALPIIFPFSSYFNLLYLSVLYLMGAISCSLLLDLFTSFFIRFFSAVGNVNCKL